MLSVSASSISPFPFSWGYTSKIKYEWALKEDQSVGTMLKYYKDGDVTSGFINEYFVRFYKYPADTMFGVYVQLGIDIGYVKMISVMLQSFMMMMTYPGLALTYHCPGCSD
jgi:hypothetical protein